MLDWALGGFQPSGPEGFQPNAPKNGKNIDTTCRVRPFSTTCLTQSESRCGSPVNACFCVSHGGGVRGRTGGAQSRTDLTCSVLFMMYFDHMFDFPLQTGGRG